MTWLDSDTALVADGVSGVVRQLSMTDGTVASVIGYPNGFSDGDDPAGRAMFARAFLDAGSIALYDDAGTRYAVVAERRGHTLRRVALVDPAAPVTWTIETWAGKLPRAACCADPAACTTTELSDPRCADDSPGVGGDALASARFTEPLGMVVDTTTASLYVADSGNHVIRHIDLATGDVSIAAGVERTLGFNDFDGTGVPADQVLLRGPSALALGPGLDGTVNGALYIADTINNRIRRLEFATDQVTTVIGTGMAGSIGNGAPARLYPTDQPAGLTLDSFGNLFFSSRTTVRVVHAGVDGVATGADEAQTIFGRELNAGFVEEASACLTGISFDPSRPDEDRLLLLDSCQGFLIELQRQP